MTRVLASKGVAPKAIGRGALGALTGVLAVALSAGSAAAQPQQTISRPVVQPIPGRDGMTLNAALSRLARNPRDADALIDAGHAALAMGDVDAATGFFRRADQVSPGNPRVKAGLAGAMVRSGDPFDAIPLFDEAEKAGALDSSLAADRGLAYDLVGDNATAQRYYRQSLARMPSEEATRRLALSYAIAGDKQNAETVLAPLLQQRNLAAWRTRAFALAILGQTEEAVKVANSILPSELASSVAPYLRYMPRLTRAQQAAAANFGAFPRASEIGRDDPRVAQYEPKRAGVAGADAALKPQGEPLGRKARGRDRNRTARAQASARSRTALAPPEPQPAREVAVAAAPTRTPSARTARARAVPTPAPTPASRPAPAPVRTAAALPAAAAPAAPKPEVAPGFSLTQSATPAPAPAPAPAAQIAEPPPEPRSLAQAFAEFGRPRIDVSPAAGAVDLRRIKPARPAVKKPVEPPKPPPPSHPSRIWVQVATGRDKAALGYDWRRMTREHAAVFRGKSAFLSDWGQTNRLLTGPFESEAAASSFIGQLRRADVDGPFVWTSPAGQVVDALPGTAPRR